MSEVINIMKEYLLKRLPTVKLRVILTLFLIPFFVYFYKITRDRIGAFGCFDDCFNITAGYFILSGKHIFTDFFFNHQPFAAFISAIIQFIFKPQSLYSLILSHREALYIFAVISDFFLILRFGLAGFIFTIIFEPAKAYLFGDRFLAEGFVVYPVVYLMGNIIQSYREVKLSRFNMLISLLSSWFIIWMREPFVPYALSAMGILFWLNRKDAANKYYIILFLGLNFLTLSLLPISEYYFNLIAVNAAQNAGSETRNIFTLNGISSIFSYPFTWFWGGIWNPFRMVDTTLAFFLIVTFGLYIYHSKLYQLGIIVYLLMILTNLRPVPPGQVYYGSFHALVRFGMSAAIAGYILSGLGQISRKYYLLTIIPVFLLLYLLITPLSYIHDKVNREAEFTTGYANVFANGNAVNILSTPEQTFFVDSIEELMYWQAKRISPYRYTWFTSIMPNVPKYMLARTRMFVDQPPDFYWGGCDGVRVPAPQIITNTYRPVYHQLLVSGKPSCLYVKNSIMGKISQTAWMEAKKYGFSP
jgi:hypothetical protein